MIEYHYSKYSGLSGKSEIAEVNGRHAVKRVRSVMGWFRLFEQTN